MNLTILRLKDARPANVPEGALIFNAPRPLAGTTPCWTGEFRHGVFYAAIHRNDPYASKRIAQNVELDGWLCEYVAENDIRAWAEERAIALRTTVGAHKWELWEESYFQSNRTAEVDLAEFTASWKWGIK